MAERIFPPLKKLLAVGIFLSFCGPLSVLAQQAAEKVAPLPESAADSNNAQETLTEEEAKHFEEKMKQEQELLDKQRLAAEAKQKHIEDSLKQAEELGHHYPRAFLTDLARKLPRPESL